MNIFSVEHSAVINAPIDRIHPLINSLRSWEQWSPWQDADPAMVQAYSGPESGVGAEMRWSGNRKAGEGTMEIVGSSSRQIEVALGFIKPFKAQNRVTFLLDPVADDGGAARLTWRMTGEQNAFERLMFTVFRMDRQLKADFARGTDRIKALAETSEVS